MHSPHDSSCPDPVMLAGMERLIAGMKDQRPVPCEPLVDVEVETVGEPTDGARDVLAGLAWNAVDTCTDELEHGTKVGRYIVVEKLGAGGMGVVHGAYDPELDRKVALKLLLPGAGGHHGQARLLREAQALAKLAHPNVVAIHDVGTVDERVWLAMEFVKGRTLRAWLETPRGWREVLAVMRSAGQGLAAAHAVGLLHRDFKPDNVMIGDDGRVRVMDFGLARVDGNAVTLANEAPPSTRSQDPLAAPITRADALVGTPQYMAPEQFKSAKLTAAADQFSFCVALWEALHGERPFAGRGLIAISTHVLEGKRRPPPHARAVPGWLRRACERGLSIDPAQRWPSMEALLDTLTKGRTRARVRKGLLGLGVIAVLGTGARAMHEYDLARRTASCEATGAEIEAVWNPEREAAMREGLLATGTSYAATTADKTVPWLEKQAEQWREARVGACLDADVHGTWDATTLERSLWCLDERRTQLDSLVDELTHADAMLVSKAVPAATGLSPVAPCRNEQVLAMLEPPPLEVREVVREVRADVMRAGNLQRAGHFAAGTALARDALARARESSWPPLVASARFQLGFLSFSEGRDAEAEGLLEEAYFGALQHATPDVAFDAAAALVFLLGNKMNRPADGRRWGRHAEALLASLPEGEGLRADLLRQNLGLLEADAGHHAAARDLCQQSLERTERALGAGNPATNASRACLLNSYDGLGEYQQALELGLRVLALVEETFGSDHPQAAKAYGDLGDIHKHLGALDEARASQERALSIAEAAFGPNHPDTAAILNNLGTLLMEGGSYDEAQARYERSLAIWEQSLPRTHPTLAMIHHNLGNIALLRGNYVRAEELHEQAVASLEASLGADHPIVAAALTSLAAVHEATGAYAEAERALERAIDITERVQGADHPQLGTRLSNLASIIGARGDLERARRTLARAIALIERRLGPDHPDLAYPLVNLAGNALRRGKPQEAVPLAERGLALFEKHGPAMNAASARLTLARALWELPAGEGRDRPRAMELAKAARDALRAAGKGGEESLAEAEAWLAEHRD